MNDLTQSLKRVIIRPHAGGLGDVLLYSTLPKLYREKQYEVFISNEIPTRNPEVADLVWLRNSHARGYREPRNGDLLVDGPKILKENHLSRMAVKTFNPISSIEQLCGFSDTWNRYPEIHYTPKKLSEWADKTVFDSSSISQRYEPLVIMDFLEYTSRWLDYNPLEVIIVSSRYSGKSCVEFPSNPTHRLRSIFELCDIIFSCRHFLCVNSGSQSLASAVCRDEFRKVYCLTTTQTYNEHFFNWPNVQYYVTGRLTEDFHSGFYG